MLTQQTTSTRIRPAETKDRSQLANLIHFESHVHRHLDWRTPLDWLGSQPYMVAEQNGQILAALACPPDPPNVAWVRVFAVSNRLDQHDIWKKLWKPSLSFLANKSNATIAAIPLQDWFKKLIEANHFQHIHNVVVLHWSNKNTLLPTPNQDLHIRAASSDDLKEIQNLDGAAFGEIWQNSLDSISLAFNQCSYATVAQQNGRIIGYQFSTPSPVGAHLARLAVHPDIQKQGIGYALVRDLQSQFEGAEPRKISVNTQDHNKASLALYEKAGFTYTDETYPVYQHLPPDGN